MADTSCTNNKLMDSWTTHGLLMYVELMAYSWSTHVLMYVQLMVYSWSTHVCTVHTIIPSVWLECSVPVCDVRDARAVCVRTLPRLRLIYPFNFGSAYRKCLREGQSGRHSPNSAFQPRRASRYHRGMSGITVF